MFMVSIWQRCKNRNIYIYISAVRKIGVTRRRYESAKVKGPNKSMWEPGEEGRRTERHRDTAEFARTRTRVRRFLIDYHTSNGTKLSHLTDSLWAFRPLQVVSIRTKGYLIYILI